MAMLARLFLLVGMAFPLLLAAQTITPEMASHARLAQEAERRNDFPTAVHEYQLLAQMLPKSAEVQSNLGVALYFDHELRPAITAFHKAIALDPNLMAPHLFSGLVWYQLSDSDAAVPELEQAVRINPSDVIAHTWLGYSYSARGQDEEALKEFEAANRLDANNADVWYALGHSWLQIGKDATVKLLAVAPDGGRGWELAAEQSELRGDNSTALKDFEEAERRRPDIAELREQIRALGWREAVEATHSPSSSGNEREEDELYQQARNAERQSHAAFEQVLQLAPNSYRAHQIMGDAYVLEKQDAKAIVEYRSVLREKPDLPGIHEAMGNAFLRNGQMRDALGEFKSELKLQPNSADAMTDVGQALLLTGQDDAADKVLTRALKTNGPPPEIYRLLGKIDMQRKDYHSAVNDLNHYVSLRKDDSTAYYLLSMAYRGLGDKKQMARMLALFQKTSDEVKQRSRAQRDLERTNAAGRAPDETMSVMNASRR